MKLHLQKFLPILIILSKKNSYNVIKSILTFQHQLFESCPHILPKFFEPNCNIYEYRLLNIPYVYSIVCLWHEFEGFCNVHSFNFHSSTSGIFGLVPRKKDQYDFMWVLSQQPLFATRIFHRSMWSVPLAGIVFWKRILIYDFFFFLSWWSNCSWFPWNVLDSTCNLPISRALLRIKWVSVSFTHLRYITRIFCSDGCVLIDHERNEWKKKKRIFLLCMRSTQLVVSRNLFLDFVAFFYHFTILYLSIINIWYIRSLYRSRELWKNLKIYRLQIFEKIVEWKESRIIAIY